MGEKGNALEQPPVQRPQPGEKGRDIGSTEPQSRPASPPRVRRPARKNVSNR